MRQLLCTIASLSLITLLTACSSMNSPDEHHRAVCNTLKGQMIFGGGTSDTRRANIENAEAPLQQRMYDKDRC